MTTDRVRRGVKSVARVAVRVALVGVAALVLGVTASAAPDDPPAGKVPETAPAVPPKDDVLTLERLFPEKSFFGPSARSASFSRDGRFAAFLYQPWAERRHGSDLYLYDTTSGQVRRITSVGRMATFEAEARKVRDEREAKAKKAGVTLTQLMNEQREAMGWTDGWVIGDWKGEATGDGTPLVAGPSALTLTEAKPNVITGTVRVGLVRLPLSAGSFDEGTGVFKATIDETTMKVKGELTLTLADRALRGAITLSEPTQTMAISLTRSPAKDPLPKDSKDRVPVGVVGAIGERLTLGDVVVSEDAEINDEKDGKPPKDLAPRYGGVASFEWSPTGSEMLLVVDGDIYRLIVDAAAWDAPFTRPLPTVTEKPPTPEQKEAVPGEKKEGDADASAVVKPQDKPSDTPDPKAEDVKKDVKKDAKEAAPAVPYRGDLTRLTRTREREADVQYLPDGKGYTYLRNNALLRVVFGEHEIVQLDPELKDSERMVGYRISPDQKRLVFLANRGGGGPGAAAGGRQVTIVNYRDRFAKAQDVARQVPDDPIPESFASVYLYDLAGHQTEEGTLERVFTRKISGPRDVMRVPEWSPDSSRVAFAAFDQQTDTMKILEAGFVDAKKNATGSSADKAKAAESVSDTNVKKDEGKEADVKKDDVKKPEKEPEFTIENAKVVYQFLHAGGPNTPGMVAPQYLPDSRRLVFITELSGFRQLDLLDPRYEQLTPLTQGQFEVYPFHLSHDHTNLFFTSTQGDPCQDHVFKINLDTQEVTRLTHAEGSYSGVAVRDDGTRLLALRTDFGAPSELMSVTPNPASPAETITTALTDSHPAEAHVLTRVSPEYFTYENRHGQTIHGHMFKPKDWSAADKRPLLVYVYGGPLGERNMASRGSFAPASYFFARYMAEKHGYVTVTIDPRGASGYGAVFEKANFEQVGKPQTEDLVDGAKWLVKNYGVDEKRMALHGWSFGGFQTQMVMYTEPDVFAAGIAGAGPTEWQNYNAWYSTGTIGANQPGKTDLEKYSLLPLAKNLKGKLLLVHGMEDSNVLYQDTVRVYRELLKAHKETNVELFLDPTGGHGLGGDVKNLGRYHKFEDFLLRTVGEGEALKSVPDAPPVKSPPEPVAAPVTAPATSTP